MNIVIFLIILIVLVLAHEFGHFFTAKRFGIRVDEFGFGFPPKITSFKKGETEYSINALPFGGFVKIFGEGLDEADMLEVGGLDKEASPEKIDQSRSLVNKPKWQQAFVMLAGIVANFILAWLLFSFGFMSGIPMSVGDESKSYNVSDSNLMVLSVLKNYPAQLAGLQTGDKIILMKAGDDTLENIDISNIKPFIVEHGNEEIEFTYLRGEERRVAQIKPKVSESELPSIGIAMDQVGVAKAGFLKSFWYGLKLDWNTSKDTVVGLYRIIAEAFQGKGSWDSIAGPVGMAKMTKNMLIFGLGGIISFAATLSISLAVINLIPFPALDGGRLLFLLIEKIKGSRINPKVANSVNMIGFALLIILMLFITFHDVVNLF